MGHRQTRLGISLITPLALVAFVGGASPTTALADAAIVADPGDALTNRPPSSAAAKSPVAAPAGASPLLNRYYQGADFQRWSNIFERPGREVFDQRFQIVYALRPFEGMRIADIGAGTGLFTVLFARAVGPEGVVYAIDTSPEFVAGIEERARQYRVANIVPLVNTQQDTLLEPGSIDLAFLSDTYHHLEDPGAMLDSIYQALVPYGALVIVDLHRRPGFSSPWIMGHVRAGMEQVIAEVEGAGFRLVESPALLRDNFYLRFEKRSDAPEVEVGPIETGAPGVEPGPIRPRTP
jgi:SAM-dependent methyltransferase